MMSSEIERLISSIVETDYTVDTIASDLCPDGFYRVTRFKAREMVIGKYEPYVLTKELFKKLNSIPYTYCGDVTPTLCKLVFPNLDTETTIYGDLGKLSYSDVVFDTDITLVGLYCLSHNVWKKEWKLPKLNITSKLRSQLLGWLPTK